MKFAILGDTHFDFYFNPNSVVSARAFDAKFKTLLDNAPADVLLIPGDIGHYNAQNIQCLRHLKRYYSRIVVTFGNHDYYLISKSMVSNYQYGTNRLGGSRERIAEMKLLIAKEEGIDYVDGNIVDIEGVRIGGASGWYDGSLLLNAGKSYDDVNWEWRLQMNDANMIYPNANNGAKFDTLFQEQKHHMENVYQHCDIMMTHVSPLSEWNQFAQMYNYQKPLAGFYKSYNSTHEALQDYRAFYCFDGKQLLENGSMKYWLFGHTHRSFERKFIREDKNEVQILCNSMGYPDKKNKGIGETTIKVFEYTPPEITQHKKDTPC
ncbi:MAG: metallophosphoesterase [Sulfuricurvum sp.]|nr:metallophosphoesterase [Sulfuricurvum sp.]